MPKGKTSKAVSKLPGTHRSKKMGRKSKLTDEMLQNVIWLCREGYPISKIAKVLDVQETTLHNWKRKNPKLFAEFRLRRLKQVGEVEESLYNCARGYTLKRAAVGTFKGQVTDIKYYDYEVGPDVNAAKYYLNNRSPERWKERVEVDGELDLKISVTTPKGEKEEFDV